jgi:hypothetical protein
MLFVGALAMWVGILRGAWEPLEFASILLIFLAAWTILQMGYRIEYSEFSVTQRAFGVQAVTIAFEDISKVQTESRGGAGVFAIRRPFRRISIYGGRKTGTDEYIDVSLKHFRAEDIRRLGRAISSTRRDLALPKMMM